MILAEMGCFAVSKDLDVQMYKPAPIHAMVVIGDVFNPSFKHQSFNLITAVNVSFSEGICEGFANNIATAETWW